MFADHRCRTIAVLGTLLLSAAGGCSGWQHVQLSLPEEYALVREQLVVHSDFPLPAQHRLMEELTARRYDISRVLALPVSNEPIHVYLFEDEKQFRGFLRLHYPGFPKRRAFFVETDTRLMVYAYWGDHVAEDLRHEVTHGYLHSMVPGLPLWLDEGLAEYFEVARNRNGLNRPHLKRLVAAINQGPWQPDLPRLELLESPFDMTQDDYAEAWSWVYYLLHGEAEHASVLRDYLQELRRDGSAVPLSHQLTVLLGKPDAQLIAHLQRVAAPQP